MGASQALRGWVLPPVELVETRGGAGDQVTGFRDGRRATSSTSGGGAVGLRWSRRRQRRPETRGASCGGLETVAERPPQPAVGPSELLTRRASSSTCPSDGSLAGSAPAGLSVVARRLDDMRPVTDLERR